MADARPGIRLGLDLPTVKGLYLEFSADLTQVRKDEATLYRRWMNAPSITHSFTKWLWVPKPIRTRFAGAYWSRRTAQKLSELQPSFDDVEAELTYLFIRALRPNTVVEISPAGGWSTSWILSALRDNREGTLYSYDWRDDSTRILPESLKQGRWVFTQGDVTKRVSTLPTNIDYLFLDADHSGEFAEWYIAKVFPRLERRTLVSVHDVFRDWERNQMSEYGESQVLLSWLSANGVRIFTAATSRARTVYDAIVSVRSSIGISGFIHSSQINPTVFFIYP